MYKEDAPYIAKIYKQLWWTSKGQNKNVILNKNNLNLYWVLTVVLHNISIIILLLLDTENNMLNYFQNLILVKLIYNNKYSSNCF